MTTARFQWIPSAIAAGGEVYTPAGYRAEWIQNYLDFLAAQEVPPGRIHRIARVYIEAANWIEAERPDGPHVLRHTWEGYLLIACAPTHADGVGRLWRRVEILNAWSRFQHWYDPKAWPYHAFPATPAARQRWLIDLLTHDWLPEY